MLRSTRQCRALSSFVAVLMVVLLTASGAPAQANSPAAPPAASQVTAWYALPNQGLGGGYTPGVRVLAMVGSDLYVGGEFSQTGDGTLTDLGNIARYDTTTGTWNALPNQGLSGYVYALALVDGDLYVAGSFSQTGDGTLTDLGKIARYDTTAGTWNALANQGLNNTVSVLALSGTDLYVGGYFDQTGDETLENLGCVARYDTTASTWNALPNQGLGGGTGTIPMASVSALAVVGSDLYVGGNFTRSGDSTLTDLGRIARYDTAAQTWNGLPNRGLYSDVDALAVVGNDLYMGGSFTRTRDGTLTNLGRIVRYDTAAETWNALPNQGLNEWVLGLSVSDGDLYVGGSFTRTRDGTLTNLGRIVRYDTAAETWNALPNQGFDDWVRAIAVVDGDLYVGGDFTQTGDGSLTNLGCIARSGTHHALYVYLPLVLKGH